MASWRYALMFGGTGCPIRAERAIPVLTKYAFDFDSNASELVSIDGHYGQGGADIDLGRSPEQELRRRLQKGDSISAQCRSDYLYVSCSFALAASDPHIRFGWPNKLLRELSPPLQLSFHNILCEIAAECSSLYVVIANDIPDGFEDYFPERSGCRSVIRQGVGDHIIDVKEVWLNSGGGGRLANDVRVRSSALLGNGFIKYEV